VVVGEDRLAQVLLAAGGLEVAAAAKIASTGLYGSFVPSPLASTP
jgi:hypothetical protein